MVSVLFVVISAALAEILMRRVKPVAADAGAVEPDRDGPSDSPGSGSHSGLAVIIPARNEAENLPVLLGDLANQSLQPGELVVVDDESTDATAALAASGGARVVSAGGRPEGWNPKVWALNVGVTATSGPRLVFLDADVRLSPDALADLSADVNKRTGLVSVAPFHKTGSAVESLSAPFNIMMVIGGGPGFGRRAQGAVGSCMIMDRADYETAGGHRADKATIVDDLALAKRTREAGLANTMRLGGQTVSVRSYGDGFVSIARGWTKNLVAGMTHSNPLTGLVVAAWLTSLVLPLWLVAQGRWAPAAATWLLVGSHTPILANRVGRFNLAVVSLGAPVLGLFVTGVTAVSAIRLVLRRPTVWKGRPLLSNGLEQTR